MSNLRKAYELFRLTNQLLLSSLYFLAFLRPFVLCRSTLTFAHDNSGNRLYMSLFAE